MWPAIWAAVAALIPILAKLLNIAIKSPQEQEDARIAALPAALKGDHDAIDQAAKGDPSALNSIINRG